MLLVIESLAEKGLEFASEIDGEEAMKTVFDFDEVGHKKLSIAMDFKVVLGSSLPENQTER